MSDAAHRFATTASALSQTLAARGTRARQRVTSALRAVAFWAAAVLPVAYVPFVADLAPTARLDLLALVVVVHACCLLAGHEHAQPARA